MADVIVKWNTEYDYKEHGANPDNDFKGNCQHFIEDVLKTLGVSLPDFPVPLKNYISKVFQFIFFFKFLILFIFNKNS